MDSAELLHILYLVAIVAEAMTAALESGNGTLGGPLLHLGILIVAYALIARLALRRFARV